MSNCSHILLVAVLTLCACSGTETDAERTTRQSLELPPAGECTVVVGSLQLHGQDAVDEFASHGCAQVEGSVLITGATDLSALSSLTRVDGDLYVRDTSLVTLVGLDSLTEVSGGLVVSNNSQLADASFPNLATAGGFSVAHNSRLTAVSATQLATVAGDFDLRANLDLTSAAFGSLTEVGGRLAVVSTSVADADGFSALSRVQDLVISNNAFLVDLTGFSTLAVIERHLVIRQNERLVSLGGFGALLSVGERVAINANDLLGSLALSSLQSSSELLLHINDALVSTGALGPSYRANFIDVSHNPLLSDLSNLPYGPNSDVVIHVNEGLTTLASMPSAALSTLTVRFNSGLRDTQIPLTSAGLILLLDNDATALELPNLGGSARLEVLDHPDLVTLEASLLTDVDLAVINNPSLTTIRFPELVSALDFDIAASPQVSTLLAPKLAVVNDDFRILSSDLIDLSGFGALASVADEFVIADSNALTSLIGLELLTTVGGRLELNNNSTLTTLGALISLIEVDDFVVTGNTALPDCEVSDLASVVTITGNTSISNNGGTAGCP